MTFFENNRERVRSHLMKFLYSDDEDGGGAPDREVVVDTDTDVPVNDDDDNR